MTQAIPDPRTGWRPRADGFRVPPSDRVLVHIYREGFAPIHYWRHARREWLDDQWDRQTGEREWRMNRRRVRRAWRVLRGRSGIDRLLDVIITALDRMHARLRP
jgi:hypothetical protein